MRKLKFFTHCILLATTPSLLAYPERSFPQITSQTVNWWGDWWWGSQEKVEEWVRPTTYDEIMQMLENLESGELEKKYPPEQLEHVNAYLAILAKEGILPNEFDEEADLEEDAYDLLHGEDSGFQLARYLENSREYTVTPAIFNSYSGYNIIQCGKISKAWNKTKKFVKKHKKEIIVGAIVVVAVAAVTIAVVVASSASAASAAAGAAGAAGSGFKSCKPSKSEPCESSSSVSSSSQAFANTAPNFQEVMEDQVASFKEHLSGENFFQSSEAGQGLSIEETGRIAGSLFAHDSFNHFNNQIPNYPQLSEELCSISSHPDFVLPPGASDNPVGFGHNEIDYRFSSNNGPMFSDPTKEVNIDALSYQMRGEAARYYGYYDQAVDDFTKAINMNPTDPMPYLQRSASYFDMSQYNKSIEDFNNFSTQIQKTPQNNAQENMDFSVSDFAIGFAKGMPKGAYKAVKDMTAFIGDFVKHPIQTSTQVIQSISLLVDLAKSNEWKLIADCVVPEARQLINEWDTLSWDVRGEKSGSLFTQYGGEIFMSGGVAKATAKLTKMGVKSAQNVSRAAKGFKAAKETLFLETAAEIGNGARVGEIINAGRNTLFLGEELGFTAKEMGQLKQAGKLETTISKSYEYLSLPMKESAALYKEAQIALKQYVKKPLPEFKVRELIHEAGIPTFPRPKGIPENYIVMISDKGAGMKYVNPKDTGTYVRIMPGKPHSPFPYQQKPYVNQRVHGKSVNKHRKKVSNDSPEAHIPIEEFIYEDIK